MPILRPPRICRSIDYLGDVPWNEDEAAKTWYARVKSRPSFRPLLGEIAAGRAAVGELRGPRFLKPQTPNVARDEPRRRWASMRSASPRPTRFPRPQDSCKAVPRRRRAWRHGLARQRSASAAPPARTVARGAFDHHARPELRARRRSAGELLEQRSRGAISVYARGDDYHDVIKAQAEDAGALAGRASRRRREGLRRHRAGDGEAARRSRRARLAGQAHQSRVARIRLVAVPRRDLHRRSNCRPDERRERSLRHLPRLPRHLPDDGVSRRPTSSMRGAASPISPSSTRARSRANSAPRSATASMAATTASRSARGTSSPQAGREAKLAARDSAARAGARRARAARRRGVPHAVLASSPIKRIGRDRFVRNVLIAIGNSGDAALAACSAERLLDDASPLVRGAAVWALANCCRWRSSRNCHCSPVSESDDSVREEWASRSPVKRGDGRVRGKLSAPTPHPDCLQADLSKQRELKTKTPPPPRSAARYPAAATGDDRRP